MTVATQGFTSSGIEQRMTIESASRPAAMTGSLFGNVSSLRMLGESLPVGKKGSNNHHNHAKHKQGIRWVLV